MSSKKVDELSDTASSSGVSSGKSSSKQRGMGRGYRKKDKKSLLPDSGRSSAGTSSVKSGSNDESRLNETPTNDSRSSSALDTSRSQFYADSEVGETQEFEWSNRNCVFFETNQDSISVVQYELTFMPVIPESKKRELFLSNYPKKMLKTDTYLYAKTDTLFTKEPIDSMTKVFTVSNHKPSFSVELTRVEDVNLELFFEALFDKLAFGMAAEEGFVPLRLLSSLDRFTRHPGKVLGVNNRSLILVRCDASPVMDFGTLQEALDECDMHAKMANISSEQFSKNIHFALRDLVVRDQKNMVSIVKSIIMHESSFTIMCREPETNRSLKLDPKNLHIIGTRCTVQADGTDSFYPISGKPISGQQRQLSMRRFYKRIMAGSDSLLREWGLILKQTSVICNDTIMDDGLALDPRYRSLIRETEGGTFVDKFAKVTVTTPVEISKWCIIFPKGDLFVIDEMVENFIREAPQIGIDMSEPYRYQAETEDLEAYKGMIKDRQKKWPDLQLVVLVVRNRRTDLYRGLKVWCLTECDPPLPSQVIMRDTAKLSYRRTEISLSLLTQMNCKLGGDLWHIDPRMKNTMVIGMSAVLGEDGEDYFGFVASRNNLFSEWYSYCMRDYHKELKDQMRMALDAHSTSETSTSNPKTILLIIHQIEDFSTEDIAAIRSEYLGNLVIVSIIEPKKMGDMLIAVAQEGDLAAMKAFQDTCLYVVQKTDNRLETLNCRILVNDRNQSKSRIVKMMKQLKNAYFNMARMAPLPAPVIYAERCAEFQAQCLGGLSTPAIVNRSLYYL